MAELYGVTNKILAEITSHILKHPDLCKFLYYTDNKYQYENLLEEEPVPASKIIDKKLFVYRRVPEVIEEVGAFMYIDLYRLTPTVLGGNVKEVSFAIDILVHYNCLKTSVGNRAVCIEEALESALSDYHKKSSLGKITLVRMQPILGLVDDYTGYTITFTTNEIRMNKDILNNDTNKKRK